VAHLYFDNDVSHRLIPDLEAAGHTVLTARDRGLAEADDNTQFLAVVRTSRLLVTHNRNDFALLHDAWRLWPVEFGVALPAHPGILVLDHGSPGVLYDAMGAFLATMQAAALANELFWWRHRDGWHRRIVGTGWVIHR
jgi:hypothetical protein